VPSNSGLFVRSFSHFLFLRHLYFLVVKQNTFLFLAGFLFYPPKLIQKMNENAQKPIAVANSWNALASTEGVGHSGRSARGGRGGGVRGGPGILPTGGDAIAAFRNARGGATAAHGMRGGLQNGTTLPTTANTESADWNTYSNRSNLQRARKEGGVRTLTVDEAIKEIEEKSTAVHTNNIGGRGALWGQWSRRMEDSRLDADCKYIDPAQNGIQLSFDEIFVRSTALEAAVASVLRHPLSDDTELAFLFSHCLEGDALFHQKIAEGVKAVAESFRDNNRPVPEDFITQMLVVIRTLKSNPSMKRDSGQALHRIDEQISYQMAKSQELAREGAASAPDARHRCSAELVRLGVEKHKLLTGSGKSPNATVAASESDALADQENVRVLFEEMLSVVNNVLSECTSKHR